MRSMTGYGRGSAQIDGRQMTVELKSVNHRFLDVAFRMPRSLSFLEEEARRVLGERLARGHVDVYISYQNLREDARTVLVDPAMLSAHKKALEEIARLSGARRSIASSAPAMVCPRRGKSAAMAAPSRSRMASNSRRAGSIAARNSAVTASRSSSASCTLTTSAN